MPKSLLLFYCKLFAIVTMLAAVVLLLMSLGFGYRDEFLTVRWIASVLLAAGTMSLLGLREALKSIGIKLALILTATLLYALAFGYYLWQWSLLIPSVGAQFILVVIWLAIIFPNLLCSLYIWQNQKPKT